MKFVAFMTIVGLVAPTDDPTTTAGPQDDGYTIVSHQSKQGTENAGASTSGDAKAASAPAVRYEWRNPCTTGSNAVGQEQPRCPQNTCPEGQEIYRLWQVEPPPATPGRLVCSGTGPPALPPQVTGAMVLNAFRRIPLPHLRSHSQPADKTLINFDTIFYTDAEPLSRTITLLGQQVRLEITPDRFEWVHGDGTTSTTQTKGAPYPSKQVVYRYADAHTTVAHHVVVTWSARWSLNGGPLQPVDGTVTTVGPATPLRVAEASPALSGEGH